METETVENSYWVLFTREVIPDSRSKAFDDQWQLVEEKMPYHMPRLLEAGTCIFMEYLQNEICLYGEGPKWTYTSCEERVSKDPKRPLVVGASSKNGLYVYFYDDVSVCRGVGGVLRLTTKDPLIFSFSATIAPKKSETPPAILSSPPSTALQKKDNSKFSMELPPIVVPLSQ